MKNENISPQTMMQEPLTGKLKYSDIQAIAACVVDILQPMLSIKNSGTDNVILNVQELAAYLKVDPSWVYKQVQYKSIPHFHAGKYPRFKRKEINTWIQEQSTPSTCAPYPKLKSR